MTRSQRELADLHYTAFTSDAGRSVLDYLRAKTRRSTYAPADGRDGIATALEGAFRAGQRSIIDDIEVQMAAARTGKSPEVVRDPTELTEEETTPDA